MEKLLAKLHQQLTADDNIKTAIIYSLRNWLAYRMQPVGETLYLERAYHGAMTAHRRNEPHVRLLTLAIFMAVEAQHLDIAETMLEKALQYRNFLKANEPFYYGVFLFLRAFLALHRNKGRATKKYRKAFLAYLKTVPYSPYYDVMQGQLHLAAQEYDQAFEYLTRAYEQKCRSVYLFEGLYRCYKATSQQIPPPLPPRESLLPVLIHSAAYRADISQILTANEEQLFAAVRRNPSGGMRLFALSDHPVLLKALCANKIQNGDCSKEANTLYRKAVEKQLHLSQLSAFLVQSSYINRIEELNTQALEQFLSTNEMDQRLAIYVCHILLTDPAHARLIKNQTSFITQTATNALEKGVTGRKANTLYQFYWAHHKTAASKLSKQAEAALQAGLTQFELNTSPQTRYVYISTQEKRGTKEYELTADTNRIIIDATDNFSYICLGAGRRQVIEAPPTIKRRVPLANPELYQHFFEKGDQRFYVLAYLASNYMTAPPDTKAIPVLEALLEEKSLQKSYRTKLQTTLGHLHYKKNNHTKALKYYAELNINDLDGQDIQQILEAYLYIKEYDLAAELIANHHSSIPAPALFEGLSRLLSYAEKKYKDIQIQSDSNQQSSSGTLGHATHDNSAYPLSPETMPHLAQAAYSLLISGHQDKALLAFTLANHQASQKELITLANTLKTPDPSLDTQILSKALWMNQFTPDTQKAFRRLHASQKALHECNKCEEYVELLTYAILSKNLQPEYETIHLLEKIHQATPQDTYLHLALCHIYLHHKITTLRSEKLLEQGIYAQEAMGILLPIFKENKPHPHPFLEKYKPFLYQGQPGKDIRLNYRIGPESDFTSIPMQYLRYGLYTAKLPLFYNETITYYYSEEMPTGSIATQETTYKNTSPYLNDNHPDTYFALNTAVVYEQMFRHELVEDIADTLVKELVTVRGRLL